MAYGWIRDLFGRMPTPELPFWVAWDTCGECGNVKDPPYVDLSRGVCTGFVFANCAVCGATRVGREKGVRQESWVDRKMKDPTTRRNVEAMLASEAERDLHGI